MRNPSARSQIAMSRTLGNVSRNAKSLGPRISALPIVGYTKYTSERTSFVIGGCPRKGNLMIVVDWPLSPKVRERSSRETAATAPCQPHLPGSSPCLLRVAVIYSMHLLVLDMLLSGANTARTRSSTANVLATLTWARTND